jgi:hypothetical protein
MLPNKITLNDKDFTEFTRTANTAERRIRGTQEQFLIANQTGKTFNSTVLFSKEIDVGKDVPVYQQVKTLLRIYHQGPKTPEALVNAITDQISDLKALLDSDDFLEAIINGEE